ncbi:auxilin-related protein 2 [Elaeis guineensis]|uniref:Auxilin-related protein 2 n=1 Tax=Elaeis guineensis var. tenera TaxID=51953 RepID=A0A6I9S188_ELAGV|nr:auxilin-related protein 2 [Elaeis guineensis]
MDEFPGLLARDFGFRPQGKNAPMAASKAASVGGMNLGSGSARSSASSNSGSKSRSGWNSTGDSLFGDHGVGIADSRSPPTYDDVFAGPPRYSNSSSHGRSGSANSHPSFDSIFEDFRDSRVKPATTSSAPVNDKPVYDDDIFDGVPGIKSSSVKYDDVFASMSAGSNHVSSPPYDDLLENLGKAIPESKSAGDKRSGELKDQDLSGFEELIPGFGGSSPPHKREIPETDQQKVKPAASTSANPFVVLETTSTSAYSSSGLFNDPLEDISRTANSGSTKVEASASEAIFDDANVFNGFSNSMPSYASEMNDNQKDKNPTKNVQSTSPGHRFGKEPPQRSSVEPFENIAPKMRPTKSSDSQKSIGRSGFHNSDTYGRNAMADKSPKSDDHLERASDAWLTINEIPLFTQPTSAPPPSRPPPPLVIKEAPLGANARRRDNESFSQSSQSYPYPKDSVKKSGVSPIDELEELAMGKPPTYAHDREEVFTNEEETETNTAAAASAAAMKEAMDIAEAKIKHAREVRGRERAQQERDEKAKSDAQDLEDREKQEKLGHEREQKEREEKEKEQKRLERERELELERERERARQAVGRATREARERAAAEARAKAERAAYEKAVAEARQRAERAAVQRAAAEARERAAAEARERAERAAAEARERSAAEAREKAAAAKERAAVERAAAEARIRAERAAVDRANAEARERAAAAAREKQNEMENDFESFFSMGARASSAPKQRAPSSETMFDTQAQGRGSSDGARRTSSGSSSTMKKASSTTNIVDDLSSIFGAPSSSGEFQEIEGESDERRKARLERHQRTLERAAKALAEKNERDLQAQREQAERHRIAETLDIEIKRWAAGKEGNLRALLSTLQYVLWPECGWQPVSLTDLITGAAVKKVYRKATLCIHPDKVQQKGANLQQKYIAEKVFDLLKEAWNKFNSEELF